MLTEIEEEISMNCEALPLLSLNHVSLLVRSVWTSVRFYEDVLGFFLVKRPSSFTFHGAWLFNYGIGVHLLQNESIDDYETFKKPINPKDNHISFQCTDVGVVKRRLKEMGMKYVTAVVEEAGVEIDQVFFHDPDGYMIEICNCNVLPMLPLSSAACLFKSDSTIVNFKKLNADKCWMMESLSINMMNFAF